MTALLSPFNESYDLGCAEAALLRGSWYEIDLGAIRHNYRELRSVLPKNVSIYACLKRNAYGCGAGPVARTLAAEGVDGFAVASLLDAMAIRRMGVDFRQGLIRISTWHRSIFHRLNGCAQCVISA